MPTNSSRRGSAEVNRSTSSPPSHRNSAIVMLSEVRAITCQCAPDSSQRSRSAMRSTSMPLPSHAIAGNCLVRLPRPHQQGRSGDPRARPVTLVTATGTGTLPY
ncbi:MAG: hypothetical protein E6Q55_05365 [Mycolicibacterium mageritense]|nr:MAG: hypothetical protein E6Q55_05365 [Mycolicibacterium mageritense]